MRINYLSDFTVRLQPTVGGEPVDITGHDFRIVFGTSGGTRRYECGKSGDTLTNCTIDGTAIVCVLDNHRLSKGQLCAWVFDYAPDATYPDGNELTVTPSEIDVTLVTGAGDGSAIDAEVAADISAAVHTAQEAAAEAAASADDAGDAAVLARAAKVAAEDAAERALSGGYTKREADDKFATKLALDGTDAAVHDLNRNKADKPMVVTITSEVVEGETIYHADKTLAQILAAAGSRSVVASVVDESDTLMMMLDLVNESFALFSSSWGNTLIQMVLGENETVWINTTVATKDDLALKADKATTYTKSEVDTALGGKQDTLTFDSAPTSGSANPVTSGGVFTAVAAKADKVAVIDASTTDDPAAITQAIAPNTFYDFGVVDSLTITLTAGESGYLAIYAFAFEANTASTTLTLPATIVGDAPTIAAGKRYECNILDNRLLFSETDGDD